jgi:hypothetical protein
MNEEPFGKTAGYLNARNYFHYIRSLTPQQATENTLTIRFINSAEVSGSNGKTQGYVRVRRGGP